MVQNLHRLAGLDDRFRRCVGRKSMQPASVRCYAALTMKILVAGFAIAFVSFGAAAQPAPPSRPIVLHAARMLDVSAGQIVSPGEVLVVGERIVAAGPHVDRPTGAEVIDLGDRTLLPGLIDAHVHLFLHPGAEDLQTVEESVPQRVILAEKAAHDDLVAGFTAERDMGTEGAGSASTAIRNAIEAGLVPGPRLRVSGNAIDITGGHEDAIGYNPAAHVPSNADYADSAEDLVRVMRQ
jgi:imidazolonepropionase-like amidohydrolase